MNETTSIPTEFPSAATVPFPYESPYKVQTELMSAILNALRQCQQQDKEEESNNCDNNNKNNMGIRNYVLDNPKKRRAPIIMLESPTGTGKSLSLACASMAWLKYRENVDLNELLLSSTSKNDDIDSNMTNSPKKDGVVKVKAVVSPSPSSPSSLTNTNNKSTNKPNIKKYDWIEAWKTSTESQSTNNDPIIMAPSSSQQPTEPTKPHSPLPWEITTPPLSQPREEQIRIFAMENRSALNQELNGIRARLDRLTTVASFASSQSSSSNVIREQERTLRDNLVRSGVASALAKERKLNRQLARRRSSGKVVVRGNTKRRKTEYGSRGVSEEEDFLLDAYHSEEEGRSKGDISSDSEDDDQIALNDLGSIGRINAKKQNSKSSSTQQQSRSSKALLEGSNLDGSGYKHDPETNARTTNHNNNSTTNDIPTVGSVSAGTGLRKIVYAARTHSQLSQFISELRRTHWGKDVKVVALGSRSLLCSNEHVLYSNKSDKKNSRRGESEITEMCLDMQKNKRDGTKKKNRLAGEEKAKQQRAATSCPYLASSEAVSTLAMHSLARPSDIEDMANLGKASHSCSYYASREALAAAEVVVVPYNTLLSPQARKSVGLSIKNALVVIDEAHNIPETLRNISSCMLSLPVAKAALSQLLLYTRKYSGRLAGRNVFYLGQIRRILSGMIKYLKRPPPAAASRNASEEPNNDDSPTERKEMMAAVDLMFTLKLDNINLFAILRYLEKSRLAQKLLGFVNHATAATAAEGSQEEEAGKNTELMKEEKTEFLSKHVSAMSIVETFLDRLCGTSREGKIIVQWPSSAEEPSSSSSTGSIPNPTFRFVQIHSASQLDNVVNEAHAIVLAGGTLRPFTHVAAELFGDDMDVMSAASHAEGQLARNYDVVTLPPTDGWSSSKTLSSCSQSSSPPPPPSSLVQITPRLTTFTCGHVIPPSNVLTACLSSGPTSKKLDFRHASRSSGDMIDELGRAILNLCNVVPKGFVVFLPSYKYESQVFQRWRSTGLLSQIGKKKSVHREPKNSRDVEAALARYSDEASRTKSGALLFSVMGGKMSEGINFANDMARCVLVAGLPFADITDPVLQEKMQSLDREHHRAAAGMGITGQAYYQNLCMRTVNQSVGRAIRHANDYAAIVLADFRYATDARIWRGLPQWLRRGRGVPKQENAAFGKVMKEVRSFFSEK